MSQLSVIKARVLVNDVSGVCYHINKKSESSTHMNMLDEYAKEDTDAWQNTHISWGTYRFVLKLCYICIPGCTGAIMCLILGCVMNVWSFLTVNCTKMLVSYLEKHKKNVLQSQDVENSPEQLHITVTYWAVRA